jgi:hypothetical protein
MAYVGNMVFALIAIGATGFFAANILRIWRTMAVGHGAEDSRVDDPVARAWHMIIGGFGQSKMFKDMAPAVMHALIFWGFVTVSIGTIEFQTISWRRRDLQYVSVFPRHRQFSRGVCDRVGPVSPHCDTT